VLNNASVMSDSEVKKYCNFTTKGKGYVILMRQSTVGTGEENGFVRDAVQVHPVGDHRGRFYVRKRKN